MGIPEEGLRMSGISGYRDHVEVPIKRFSAVGTKDETMNEILDTVITESSLTVFYRDISINIPSCSLSDMEYLALGHLITCGFIKYTDKVPKTRFLSKKNMICVEPEDTVSAGMPCQVPPNCKLHPLFSSKAICEIFDDLLKRSSLFKMTGATHAAALCDNKGILLWHEDVGRHNAVDKVIGHAFAERIPPGDKMIALTGRINTEVVGKVISVGIPVVASKAPPTDMAIEDSQGAGVTIIGFVRDRCMSVYSNSERVVNTSLTGRKQIEPG